MSHVMNQLKLPLKTGFRSLILGVTALAVSLASTLTRAEPSGDYFETPGPWEGFPRTQPTPKYENDVGADKDYKFGVTKAFSPYKDPDISETEGLTNPLENHDFDSYNLIIVVSKKDDPYWGKAQTLRVYKRDIGLHYYWMVSSGQKGFETASGYFRPQAFSSRHWSGKYDAPMLWAVFFNGGMALHSSLDRLAMQEMGNAAASHGCVHVEDYRAEELFHLVGHSGFGPVEVIDRNTGRKTGGKAQSYKTLIIVGPTGHWGQKGLVPSRVSDVVKPATRPAHPRSPKPAKAVGQKN
jgi:lipoprotein-anchoring transpeptidase ErfK/SrfK